MAILVFKTKVVEKDGKKIIQRMVFKNIKEDSFTWIWEGREMVEKVGLNFGRSIINVANIAI